MLFLMDLDLKSQAASGEV